MRMSSRVPVIVHGDARIADTVQKDDDVQGAAGSPARRAKDAGLRPNESALVVANVKVDRAVQGAANPCRAAGRRADRWRYRDLACGSGGAASGGWIVLPVPRFALVRIEAEARGIRRQPA